MRKKSLIKISLILAVFIVLSSLSNVVGYHVIHSSTLRESPLFSIRTKRAINQISGGDTIDSSYLGKGSTIGLQIPIPEEKMIFLQKIIVGIKLMDDKEFTRLLGLVLTHLSEDEKYKTIDPHVVVLVLKHLRTDTKESQFVQFALDGATKNFATSQNCSIPSVNVYPPWCLLLLMFIELIGLCIVGIIIAILSIFLTVNCGQYCWFTV
jgi:hypothetical protein